MAGTVLLITIIVEAAFAVYCIVTRSDRRRLRNWIRVGAFLAFIVFVLLGVLQWSFRWIALCILLLIWAVVGAVQLLRGRLDASAFKPGRVVGRALGTLVLIFLVLIPAFVFPQHKLPRVTGPHSVATALYYLVDPDRIETHSSTGKNRQVNVECWYPADGPGKYPLVLFSHGAMGIKLSNTSTFTELASNGYVVCSMDHPYDSFFTRGADGRLVTTDPGFRAEIVGINNGTYTEAASYDLYQKWLQVRTADINFVLDTILSGARAGSDPVYSLIDIARIGLMGHSLGGASVGLVARERGDVDAVVLLDADLQGDYVDYSDGKYTLNDEAYPVPLFTIMADDVVNLIARIPDPQDTVAIEHVLATSPHTFRVHIQGTDHQSVTDLALISPFFNSLIVSTIPKTAGGKPVDRLYVVETMNGLVLQFFDAYVKGQGTFNPNPTY